MENLYSRKCDVMLQYEPTAQLMNDPPIELIPKHWVRGVAYSVIKPDIHKSAYSRHSHFGIKRGLGGKTLRLSLPTCDKSSLTSAWG